MAVLTLFTAAAQADAIDRLGEGAPLYVAARPVALIGVMQRVGVADLPAVKQLRRQMGGIDIFNPAILAAPGIDVAAPLVGSLFEPAPMGKAAGRLYHHRLVATLRDPGMFSSFVVAVAASGQLRDLQRVDPESPQGRQGVLATAHPSSDVSIVLRQKGDLVVLDALQSVDDKGKAPSPSELLRRYPLQPSRPFTVGKGARKLFVPDPQAGAPAAVLYIDGRRIGGLIDSVQADDLRHAVAWAQPSERARLNGEAQAELRKCNQLWDRAPATFDDVALALSAAPDGLGVTLAWGTQSGPPLGGLKLLPVDDGGLDAVELARDAALVVALYAASLQPFETLKHTGPFASADKLMDALKGCEAKAGALLFVRSWPLALGALASAPPALFGPMKPIVATLRTVTVALRDLRPADPHVHFAVGGTFDGSALGLVQTVIAATPGSGAGAQQTLGKRTATIYSVPLGSSGSDGVIAIDTLANNRFELAAADSEETLAWAYRAGDAAAARPPVLRLAADLAALAKMGESLGLWREGQADLLAQLRHVDGELVSDGDLLRLDLHAPLKH